ncbi:Cell division cycle-associated 7-like protein [Chlorella vulgaris]
MLNDYELARAERIASNKAKLAVLGIAEAAEQLQVTSAVDRPARNPIAAVPRKKRKMYEVEVEVRRCGRLNGERPEYNEETLFDRELGIDRLDLLASRRRRRRVGMDPTALGAIRERRIREVDGEDADVPRGPFDSGRGVRIQGGRVYDSKYGVTCHWCRQKTLEEHVTCTHPDCGAGRRLAVAFCKLCLKNRHGEDIQQAEASSKWVCPRCRGSCGEGCASCCNCGPCRKALGLAPTHQIINQARAAGFENVHDFLVHQKTGEAPEEVAARKQAAAWGTWLDVPFDAEAAAAAGSGDEEEEEEEAVLPAAAAGAVQLERRQQAAVPEGAGAAMLLFAALRWHLLATSFFAAAKVLAPKPAAAVPSTRPTSAAKPKPAAAKQTQQAAAPRRYTRTQAAGQAPTKLAAKVTAFFQAAAATSAPKAAPERQAAAGLTSTKAATAKQAASGLRSTKAAATGADRPRASNRLGMRARK